MEDNSGMSVSRSDLLAGGAKIDTGPCIDRSSEFLFVPLKERQQIIDVQCSATWKGRNEWMTEKSWLCAIKVDSFWRDENEGNTCANCVSQMSELILSNFAFCFVWFVWLSLAQMWEREESGFLPWIISMSSATATALWGARTAALRKNVERGIQGPGLVTYLAVPTRKTVCTTIMLPRGERGRSKLRQKEKLIGASVTWN